MKTAKIALQIMIVLVIVVVTSSLLLLLVRTGLLEVKETSGANLLDAEFIPITREGYLVIKDLKFCSYVDADFECIRESNVFDLGDQVHFIFNVESSVYRGEVKLVKNYAVKGTRGETLLAVDETNNFYFDVTSSKAIEEVKFRDYFTVGEDLELGNYTLEMVISNPLLNKQTKIIKQFEITDWPEVRIE